MQNTVWTKILNNILFTQDQRNKIKYRKISEQNIEIVTSSSYKRISVTDNKSGLWLNSVYIESRARVAAI